MRLRRRRPEPTFRLIDQATGLYLEPWQLRAGMKVVETTYYHDSRTAVAVVKQLNARQALAAQAPAGPGAP